MTSTGESQSATALSSPIQNNDRSLAEFLIETERVLKWITANGDQTTLPDTTLPMHSERDLCWIPRKIHFRVHDLQGDRNLWQQIGKSARNPTHQPLNYVQKRWARTSMNDQANVFSYHCQMLGEWLRVVLNALLQQEAIETTLNAQKYTKVYCMPAGPDDAHTATGIIGPEVPVEQGWSGNNLTVSAADIYNASYRLPRAGYAWRQEGPAGGEKRLMTVEFMPSGSLPKSIFKRTNNSFEPKFKLASGTLAEQTATRMIIQMYSHLFQARISCGYIYTATEVVLMELSDNWDEITCIVVQPDGSDQPEDTVTWKLLSFLAHAMKKVSREYDWRRQAVHRRLSNLAWEEAATLGSLHRRRDEDDADGNDDYNVAAKRRRRSPTSTVAVDAPATRRFVTPMPSPEHDREDSSTPLATMPNQPSMASSHSRSVSDVSVHRDGHGTGGEERLRDSPEEPIPLVQHNSTIDYTLPMANRFCTHNCLLYLRDQKGEPDGTCPFARQHRAFEGNKGSLDQVVDAIGEILANPGQFARSWSYFSMLTRGAYPVMIVRHKPSGYVMIAKGYPNTDEGGRDAEQEENLYNALDTLQGKHIPVFLRRIRARQHPTLSEPLGHDCGQFVLQSFAGISLSLLFDTGRIDYEPLPGTTKLWQLWDQAFEQMQCLGVQFRCLGRGSLLIDTRTGTGMLANFRHCIIDKRKKRNTTRKGAESSITHMDVGKAVLAYLHKRARKLRFSDDPHTFPGCKGTLRLMKKLEGFEKYVQPLGSMAAKIG